jgi:hypothetical protein
VITIRNNRDLSQVIRCYRAEPSSPTSSDPVECYYDELFRELLGEVHFFFRQYLERLETQAETPFLFFQQRLLVILDSIAEAAPALKKRFEAALASLKESERETACFVLGSLRLLQATSWSTASLLNRLEAQGRVAIDRLIAQTVKTGFSQIVFDQNPNPNTNKP